MKRIFISIAVLVGVGGLIGLLTYHPKTSALDSSNGSSSTSPSSLSASSPNSGSTSTPNAASSSGKLKDGSYTGNTVDVGYGPVQVQAVISGGKLTGVNFLQMPSDRGQSMQIASEAEPLLLREALSAQSANVDTVSGATQDSQGFAQSLQSALSQAGS